MAHQPGDLWYTLGETAAWLGRNPNTFKVNMKKRGPEWKLAPYVAKDERGRWIFNVSAIHRDWFQLYPSAPE